MAHLSGNEDWQNGHVITDIKLNNIENAIDKMPEISKFAFSYKAGTYSEEISYDNYINIDENSEVFLYPFVYQDYIGGVTNKSMIPLILNQDNLIYEYHRDYKADYLIYLKIDTVNKKFIYRKTKRTDYDDSSYAKQASGLITLYIINNLSKTIALA